MPGVKVSYDVLQKLFSCELLTGVYAEVGMSYHASRP